MAGPVVVKFGGSLIGSPEILPLLDIASRSGAIVAPGGGPFADAVREAQANAGFSDAAAHAMAILAMEQTAMLFEDLAPSLAPCATREAFAAAQTRGLGAIWRPSAMALGADLPRSWDVTSDSLAIWLAVELRARRVVLLKSAEVASDAGLDALAAADVVDAFAPKIAGRLAGEIRVVGPASAAGLEAALASSVRRAA